MVKKRNLETIITCEKNEILNPSLLVKNQRKETILTKLLEEGAIQIICDT